MLLIEHMERSTFLEFSATVATLIGSLVIVDEHVGTLASRKFKQIEIDSSIMLDNGETEEEAVKFECRQLSDFFNYCVATSLELGIITEGDLDKYKEVFDEFSRIDTATQQGRL